MEIVHRDEKGKVLERRKRERGEKTAVKGKTWRVPGKEGPERSGKETGKDDPPSDRWMRVGQDEVHNLGESEWKEESPVPDKEPR